jgi:O-antigen ligase
LAWRAWDGREAIETIAIKGWAVTKNKVIGIILAGLEWAFLLAALSGLTLTEEYRPYVAGCLVALVLTFPVRWLRTGRLVCITGLEAPGVLFVVSAGIGVWAAYDRPLALLLFARIIAAVALYHTLVASGEKTLEWVAAGFVLAAAALALYWPTQHDFAAEPAKLALLTQIGQWINAHLPHLPGPSIHGNIAGGTLTLALPFATVLSLHFWRQRRKGIVIAGALLAAVLVGGLVLTGNRGGWLSVAVVMSLAALAWAQRRWFPQGRQVTLFWGGTAAVVLAAGAGVLASGNLGRLLGALPGPSGSLQDRTHLWKQGVALIRDYAFTGCGLRAFPMVYSTYGILIHAPVLTHIHNTYLEIWIEQGMLGVLALVWGGVVVLTWALWALRGTAARLLGWAGLAALAALGVHGMFDTALYGARMTPLLGLVAGYGWWAVRDMQSVVGGARLTARRVLALVAGVVALLAVTLLFCRPVVGAWYANLGALAQARVELQAYDSVHFDDPSMDRIRRTADLSVAEQRFARALTWDRGNLTARQRLGAVALSRGEYEEALAHMQAAWYKGRRDDVTRLLLGDALVASGRVEEAAEVVRGLGWAESRLMFQGWYRYWLDGDYGRTADVCRAVLLLNPANEWATRQLVEAEARLGANGK